MAGHAVYPTYHHLYEFDYKYGAVSLLPLLLKMGSERFFFSAVMGKAGEYEWVEFCLCRSFKLLFYLRHFKINYRHLARRHRRFRPVE